MKKLLALLLVLVMVFSVATVFAGCEDDSKKSSKSEEKEEEEDEKKDDETTAPEEDGTTAPEAPTDPEPTEPDPTETEPTEPEPTETEPAGELMDAPDVTFDTSIQSLAMLCTVYSDGNETSIEVDVQYVSDDEMLVCYCDYTNEIDVILYITSAGQLSLYRYTEEGYVLDESATEEEIYGYFTAAANISNMFTDYAVAFGEGCQYKNVGTAESEDFGEVVAYEVYDATGTLTYAMYVQVETGIIVGIVDANGDPVAAITYMTQDFDLTELIVG